MIVPPLAGDKAEIVCRAKSQELIKTRRDLTLAAERWRGWSGDECYGGAKKGAKDSARWLSAETNTGPSRKVDDNAEFHARDEVYN